MNSLPSSIKVLLIIIIISISLCHDSIILALLIHKNHHHYHQLLNLEIQFHSFDSYFITFFILKTLHLQFSN